MNVLLPSLLVLFFPGFVCAVEPSHVIPRRPDPPIALDADLSDWTGMPNPVRIDTRKHVTLNPESWTGPADLSAVGGLAWRQEGLYLGLSIKDEFVTQKQRGALLYRGDHVELFLDFTPDREPTRTGFGKGQFQFAFSPGNFKRTGDALADIPPEVYCYQPPGGAVKGIEFAARKTPTGWSMEAMIPFALLGVTPEQNMVLGCEVALSDCDSAEPAQETFMTWGTTPWVYSRSRLLSTALGDVQGHARPPATSIPLAKELMIPAGEAKEVTFPRPAVPKGKEVYLFFKARIAASRPAGYTRGLRLLLNGTPVEGDRLSNRPRQSMRKSGTLAVIVTPAGALNVPYSPDYTSYDRDSSYGLLGGVKANEFEFRLRGLLVEGTNVLRLQSLTDKTSHRDLVLADVALRIKPPPPAPARKRPAPTGPLEVIAPRQVFKTTYAVGQPAPAVLELRVGAHRFRIESRFSSPDGKWNAGGCRFYSFQRRIRQEPECVRVFDTFKNLTTANVPLKQRHTCTLGGRLQHVWIAGLSPQSNNITMTEPANPSSYAAVATAGIGMLPFNDEFQVHVVNWALQGTVGMSDDTFVLSPGRTYTAEWGVIPTAKPDFWEFVNTARRVREVNFTLPYQFAFLSTGPRVQGWSDDTLRTFIRNKSADLVCASINYPRYKGSYSHGTAFQFVDHTPYARHNDRVRRVAPGTKTAVYFHCYIDVRTGAEKLFAKDRLLRSNGEQGVYGKPIYKLFIPTLLNRYGREVAKNLDLILGVCKADGVYWDELAYSRYRYHYGQPWDGCSGDIDPQTLRLKRLKSSVTLLTLPFRKHHVQRLLAHGPFIANGQPHTRTMARLHYPCFVETASLSNCLRALLYSPIALGDHLTERTGLDAYLWMLGALNFGCVYNWYSDVVMPRHETLAKYMFPITPLELHEGFILGEERILTNRSGLFGWGDASPHEVHVFNDRGAEVPDFDAPLRIRNGKTYTELRLAEDWSAAIIRVTRK